MPPSRFTLPRLIDAVRWRLPRPARVTVEGVRRARLLTAPGMVLDGGGTVVARTLGPRSYALDVRHDVTVRDVTLVGGRGSYAVHIDHEGARRVLFEDCTLIAFGLPSLGVGIGPGQTFTFRRCRFLAHGEGVAAVYVHPLCEDAGPTFEDCIFESDGPAVVRYVS